MSVLILYRVRCDTASPKWMLPPNKWYHNHMTFTTNVNDAHTCTLLECENYLERSDCPAGSYHESVLPI